MVPWNPQNSVDKYTLGTGGNAQVADLSGGTSLILPFATSSESVASLCIRRESGAASGSVMVYDTSSSASHVNALWMWLSRSGGDLQLNQLSVREDGCSLLTRGYAIPQNFLSFPLGECGQIWPQQMAYGLWPPSPQTQPRLIFRTAAGFGFFLDAFFSLSLAYFSLDLR